MKFTGPGGILSLGIHTPGTGYTTGDVAHLLTGQFGTLIITSVLAGVPQTIAALNRGRHYVTANNVATTSAVGIGLTVDLIARPLFGFAPFPGSGDIEQTWRDLDTVRRRTIQHKSQRPQNWHGLFFLANPGLTPWFFNNTKLAVLARFWAENLSAGDRSGWDTYAATIGAPWDGFAPGSITGFEAFMSYNKVQGDAVCELANPLFWSFNPRQPTAPAAYTAPPTAIVTWTITTAPGTQYAAFTATVASLPALCHWEFHATRPYNSSRRPRRAVMVRYFEEPSLTIPNGLDVSSVVERLSPQGQPGQSITVGLRLIDIAANVDPGPLNVQQVTIT
jgi:hypothetical protein